MSKLSKWKNRDKSHGIPKLDSSIEKHASAGQERLFFLQQMHGDSLFYQYGHLYRFKSSVDPTEIERRFSDLLKNHEVLRSNYFLEGDKVKVKIRPEEHFKLENNAGSQHDFFQKTFDLNEDLLIRAKLFDKNTLALSMHHIIADRQSLHVINRVLFDGNHEKANNVDYFDFAHWYNKQINNVEDLEYWSNKLSHNLTTLSLPLDHSRKQNPTYAGKTLEKKVDQKLLDRITELCTLYEVTMYVFLLGAFKLLLHKYAGQNDIIVGTPVTNRDRNELHGMIGFFNETIALRSKINTSFSFAEFLADLKKEFLDSLMHKNVSFSSLVSEVNPDRIPGVNPIFQTMFLFNRNEDALTYKDEIVEEEVVDLGISKFDVTLFAHEDAKGLSFRLEYSTELFEESSMERFFDDYEKVLYSITSDSYLKIADLTLYPISEESTNSDDYGSVQEDSILEIIDFSRKEKVVISLEGSLTYEELGRRSDAIASKLLDLGLKKNDFVGLYINRSVEMVVGIIAILKAGGAYLPLDPNYPEERIGFMKEDAGCDFILSTQELLDSDRDFVDINGYYDEQTENMLPKLTRDDLAYIIYTSGSSGIPKGVPISHGNLLYSTQSRFHFYGEHPGTFMLLSSFSFDSSVAGIFWTLCSGGTLLLPPERIEQNISSFAEFIAKYQVTHTLMLPSLYELLLDYSETQQLQSLKNVMVAGESCSHHVLEKHFLKIPECRLYNEYGPTEATVWCIAHEVRAVEKEVPIGKAIPFYQAYILDPQMKIVPPRVGGELYIGGPGLSKGYLNRADLTEEKFIEHKTFGRIYKTGDLAKKSIEGEIHFLGRADSQVKIRGHRVELDEIKNRILERSNASEVEVVFRDGKLLAYSNGDVESALDLPDYMTPSHVIMIEEFPKLPNGKTDLNRLPAPSISKNQENSEGPRTEVEKTLHHIWQEVLKQKEISINDNFFDIGGDSLLSIQMVAKARLEGIEMLASALFSHQNIKKLASHIEDNASSDESQIVVPLKKQGKGTPLFCIHGGGAHVFFYKPFAEHLRSDTPVYSFQPEGLDGKTQMSGNIVEMSSKYIAEMKKIQPNGPYQILGTCFSNAVALEMANQLLKGGDRVENLFIIDSAPVHLFGNKEEQGNQTIQRFLDMLKRGDFSRIKSKLSRRLFGQKQWNSPIKDATESDHVLKATISALNKMYADYDWKPFKGSIHFIRSSEFNARKDKNYHLVQWKKLAKDGLNVDVVEGHHLTLFQEPEVQGLASKVSDLLSVN
jgi:amino acid adenylation domain-containing protein